MIYIFRYSHDVSENKLCWRSWRWTVCSFKSRSLCAIRGKKRFILFHSLWREPGSRLYFCSVFVVTLHRCTIPHPVVVKEEFWVYVACLLEETVWNIASIIVSLGCGELKLCGRWLWGGSEVCEAPWTTRWDPDHMSHTLTGLTSCAGVTPGTWPRSGSAARNRTAYNIRTMFHVSVNFCTNCQASAFAVL